LKGIEFMKKAVNVLIAVCLLGAIIIVPPTSSGLSPGVVEASPYLATITGTVKDELGAPLVGAIVSLHEPQLRGKEINSVKTDGRGKFLTAVAPGTYRLRAAAEGFVATFTRVKLDRPMSVNHDFALRRNDTLVQKRGDSDDYRWIARSSNRHVLNYQEGTEEAVDNDAAETTALQDESKSPRPTFHAFHGMTQFLAVSSASRVDQGNFFGTNFALSGAIGDNFEMALIGQLGAGQLSPQRFSAMATMRPGDKHQVTASIGYGQVALARKMYPDAEISGVADFGPSHIARNIAQVNNSAGTASEGRSLDQISVSATGSWQILQPLLVIYGFDYSRFVGPVGGQNDSVLPRLAVQYAPTARLHLNAALTPGTDQHRRSTEGLSTENIQASFEDAPPEIAFNNSPILDRSRRFEVGIERLFGDGDSALEFSAFYDLISGHGVGVLALPLEASPETQATLQEVAHQITAMNGAARGIRVMYKRNFTDHISASVGYSFGRGARLNQTGQSALDSITPAQLFRGGFFQVATAKLDLDYTQETGTRISTVIRFSPSAVVFAIDPFAGRMSVYDPNINIYVTQDLPNFGLPVRWQALVDVRNLLDHSNGVDDGMMQLVTARSHRTVRGGLAFRW
jgi:Carboxypeptidase regulatory-like domain/TonB dependent receptor